MRFALQPEFEIKHESVYHPDGLCFSGTGKWLAVADHGRDTVAIFRRRPVWRGGPRYEENPVIVIADPNLCYPHSVAFTRRGHLAVTNAGANYLCIYSLTESWFSHELFVQQVTRLRTNDDADFRAVNASNKMEGGPKGLATSGSELAVCCPEFGIKIYKFRER